MFSIWTTRGRPEANTVAAGASPHERHCDAGDARRSEGRDKEMPRERRPGQLHTHNAECQSWRLVRDLICEAILSWSAHLKHDSHECGCVRFCLCYFRLSGNNFFNNFIRFHFIFFSTQFHLREFFTLQQFIFFCFSFNFNFAGERDIAVEENGNQKWPLILSNYLNCCPFVRCRLYFMKPFTSRSDLWANHLFNVFLSVLCVELNVNHLITVLYVSNLNYPILI